MQAKSKSQVRRVAFQKGESMSLAEIARVSTRPGSRFDVEEIQRDVAEIPTVHLLRERARGLEAFLSLFTEDSCGIEAARFEVDAIASEIRHRESTRLAR